MGRDREKGKGQGKGLRQGAKGPRRRGKANLGGVIGLVPRFGMWVRFGTTVGMGTALDDCVVCRARVRVGTTVEMARAFDCRVCGCGGDVVAQRTVIRGEGLRRRQKLRNNGQIRRGLTQTRP